MALIALFVIFAIYLVDASDIGGKQVICGALWLFLSVVFFAYFLTLTTREDASLEDLALALAASIMCLMASIWAFFGLPKLAVPLKKRRSLLPFLLGVRALSSTDKEMFLVKLAEEEGVEDVLNALSVVIRFLKKARKEADEYGLPRAFKAMLAHGAHICEAIRNSIRARV